MYMPWDPWESEMPNALSYIPYYIVFKYFCDIDHLFQISGGACGLVLTANAIMFLTILGFFIAFDGDDVQYSVW